MNEQTKLTLAPGLVCTVGVLSMPAVIVCADEESPFGVDIRVVPLSPQGDRLEMTDRDVSLTAEEIGGAFGWDGAVAHAWLAEPVQESDIRSVNAVMRSEALRVVTDVELVSYGAVAESKHADRVGAIGFIDATHNPAHRVHWMLAKWRRNIHLSFLVHAGAAPSTVNVRRTQNAFFRFAVADGAEFAPVVAEPAVAAGASTPTATESFSLAA